MTVREFEAHSLHTLDAIAGLVRRAPADQLAWRPVDGALTLGQLLAHVAGSLTDVVEMVLHPEAMPSEEEMAAMMDSSRWPSATPDEALATIAEQKAKLPGLLAEVTDERWLTEQRALPWGVRGSLGLCAMQGLEHAVSHRSQLFWYLKILGHPISTMELYGMA